MSEERAIYNIAPQEPAQQATKTAQEVINDIADRLKVNLIWLLGQIEEDQAREIVEEIIKTRPALTREILDNMDNVTTNC